MKKTIILSLFSVALLSNGAFAQEKVKTEVKTEKKIRKEVKMEDENGEKVLTIMTDEDGKKTEELYKGEAAEEKLAELQAEHGKAEKGEETIEVKMEEVDGKKVLTVITNINGKVTKEVYEGEDAETKLKELELSEPKPTKRADQIILKKEKRVIQKENM